MAEMYHLMYSFSLGQRSFELVGRLESGRIVFSVQARLSILTLNKITVRIAYNRIIPIMVINKMH